MLREAGCAAIKVAVVIWWNIRNVWEVRVVMCESRGQRGVKMIVIFIGGQLRKGLRGGSDSQRGSSFFAFAASVAGFFAALTHVPAAVRAGSVCASAVIVIETDVAAIGGRWSTATATAASTAALPVGRGGRARARAARGGATT